MNDDAQWDEEFKDSDEDEKKDNIEREK